MNIWYTPERIALQQEVGERRMARYERREARRRRQERIEAAKTVVRFVVMAAGFFSYLLIGALWASM